MVGEWQPGEEGTTALNYHDRMATGVAPPPTRVTPRRSQWLASAPNLISVGRLVFVPLIIALILDRRWTEVFACFVLAGLSDAVDGFIAKQFGLTSELGAYLDPLADKALLISIFVALAAAAVIPAWLAILVVSRDVMIVGAVIVALLIGRPIAIRPLPVSKANTTVQIAFAAGVLAAKAFAFEQGTAFTAATVVVSALTVASAGAYLARWLDHMSR